MKRCSFGPLLLILLLLAACSTQAATSTVAPPTTGPTPAASTVVQATTPPLATASRAASVTVASPTVASASATPASSATAPPVVVPATVTRASTVTTGSPVAASPVATAAPPLGAAPAGWQTYSGNRRAPFSIYYPPGWTVDESRANEGRVYFYGPGVREPFEDALWVLIATTGKVEPTATVDALRDDYLNSEIKNGHPEAGVDVTRMNQFSGLTFASLGATFNAANGQLCYAYIGLGLRGQVPWRFRLNSTYSDYARNLDSTFSPMIASLNIYANP